MRVLLVDDEIFTIRMLQNLIHWKDMGLELLGYAQSGEEAYEMVVRDRPDIIVSDIKMPGMSGLEFLKKIHNYDATIKTLLMSAYADFSYVKEGMRLGCSDYILKPVDESELEQALRKVMLEIQGEKAQEQVIVKSEKQLDKINLYQYMRSGHGINKIKKHSQTQMEQFSVFVMQVNSATIDEYNNSANIEMGQEDYISNVLERIFTNLSAKSVVFDYEDGCWVIVLEASEKLPGEEVAEKLIQTMKEETGIQVNVCFSSVGHKLEQLPLLYEEVKNLSKYSFYVGEKDILGYGYNCDKKELNEVRDIGITKDIEQAVRSKDAEKIKVILNEAFELSLEYAPGKLRNIYEICYQTILFLRKQIPVQEQKEERYKKIMEITYDQLAAIPSLKELKALILELSESISGAAESKEKIYSKPVKECILLMEQHYNENLSLEDICEKIAVSKNYFCYLFKRETGMSVWNYLTMIRIQHARQLLENTSLRSYEIAFKVGYDNPSYFSKLFKKYENVSPNEYRENRK